MRLWHKDLIEALPRQQLVAQWRELSSIAGNVLQKGNPNHILVNKVMNYPFNHFITYAATVRKEMTKRGYKTMDKVWDKIISISGNDYNIIPLEEIYLDWMNDEYFIICYYNLKEKWLCGGITNEEWNKIEEKRKELKINELYS